MASFQDDGMLDAALNWVKNNATYLSICSALPTTYTEAYTTYMLARKAVTSLNFTGPTNWTDANTGQTGRQLQVDGQTFTGSNGGTGIYLSIIGVVSTVDTLMYVVPCESTVIYAAVEEDMAAWTIHLGDVNNVLYS